MITLMDIAWAAGIYEGEGSVDYGGTEKVTVVQKDSEKWLVKRLCDLFGGAIYPRIDKPETFIWTLGGSRARGFLLTIYGLLSPRRKAQIRRRMYGGRTPESFHVLQLKHAAARRTTGSECPRCGFTMSRRMLSNRIAHYRCNVCKATARSDGPDAPVVVRAIKQPRFKLSATDVMEIRRAYATGGVRTNDLAARYGVAQPTISKIIIGSRWSHLPLVAPA